MFATLSPTSKPTHCLSVSVTWFAYLVPSLSFPRVLIQTSIHHPFTHTDTYLSVSFTSVTGPMYAPVGICHSVEISVPSRPCLFSGGGNQLPSVTTGASRFWNIAGSSRAIASYNGSLALTCSIIGCRCTPFVGFLRCSMLCPEVPCLRHRLPCLCWGLEGCACILG